VSVWTITSRMDNQNPAGHEYAAQLIHDLIDPDGNLVATGMTDTDCLLALEARAGGDIEVTVKSGALGRTADETTTVGALLA